MKQWTGDGLDRERHYYDETGKILAHVEGTYSHSRCSAYVRGPGFIGEYLTQRQAMEAVQRAVSEQEPKP